MTAWLILATLVVLFLVVLGWSLCRMAAGNDPPELLERFYVIDGSQGGNDDE
jgi:hypothetical protein